jgi:glutamate formiminotransferase
MNRIVECVPNFSEGRRPEVVDAIINAILSGGDVYLLDREMDTDHNRAVVTVVGPPEAIGEAAFRGVQVATQHIDLTKHQGAHPRIGATDVVPFIPIRGVTLEECVAISRDLGRQIWEKLRIPVYLYEAAATQPDRTNLENIRKGQFEGLRDEIETNPARKPDFGDARIHATAGATVVGARKPLIAYNINLNTPDIAIAKNIAKRIRFSTGGLRYVKAMGVMLKERNQAQVSMNLTDYEQTSIELVFETVRSEAERFGATIVGSEIVGLIPQKALEQAAEFYLRVENFKPAVILENRLAEVMASISRSTGAGGSGGSMTESLRPFVDRVASAEAVPGGGSVAALSGALGASLGRMCIRITKTKKSYAHLIENHVDAQLAECTKALLELVDADSGAFNRVMTAYRMPKDSPDRSAAIQEALIGATETPARTAKFAFDALRWVEELRSAVHPNVASDLEVAQHMLRASVRSAIANMRINLADVKEIEVHRRYEEMIAGWEKGLGN